MKQLTLELKKRLLIVEVPRLEDFVIERINIPIVLRVGDKSVKLKCDPDSEFKLICKGSELTEELAKGLVESPDNFQFLDAENTFIGEIEKHGYYWGENPIYFDDEESDFDKRHEMRINGEKAESKTFNPEKTLIFEILL